MKQTLETVDILEGLSLKVNQWTELKGKEQDVTQENFIDTVILTLGWVMTYIEQM